MADILAPAPADILKDQPDLAPSPTPTLTDNPEAPTFQTAPQDPDQTIATSPNDGAIVKFEPKLVEVKPDAIDEVLKEPPALEVLQVEIAEATELVRNLEVERDGLQRKLEVTVQVANDKRKESDELYNQANDHELAARAIVDQAHAYSRQATEVQQQADARWTQVAGLHRAAYARLHDELGVELGENTPKEVQRIMGILTSKTTIEKLKEEDLPKRVRGVRAEWNDTPAHRKIIERALRQAELERITEEIHTLHDERGEILSSKNSRDRKPSTTNQEEHPEEAPRRLTVEEINSALDDHYGQREVITAQMQQSDERIGELGEKERAIIRERAELIGKMRKEDAAAEEKRRLSEVRRTERHTTWYKQIEVEDELDKANSRLSKAQDMVAKLQGQVITRITPQLALAQQEVRELKAQIAATTAENRIAPIQQESPSTETSRTQAEQRATRLVQALVRMSGEELPTDLNPEEMATVLDVGYQLVLEGYDAAGDVPTIDSLVEAWNTLPFTEQMVADLPEKARSEGALVRGAAISTATYYDNPSLAQPAEASSMSEQAVENTRAAYQLILEALAQYSSNKQFKRASQKV